MNNNEQVIKNNVKSFFKYISTVISWTIFVLLVIVGALLIYYFVSMRLYASYGEKFEPKFSVYTIVSISMEPTINVYDVIINTKVDNPSEIKQGDVITFISSWNVTYGMTITHRVVGTKVLDDGSKCLITRGDNNTQEDQACVKESNIIGVVKAVIPSLGRVQFFLSSYLGWFLIIIKDIIKIIKLAKDNKKDKVNNKSEDNKTKKKSNLIGKNDIDNVEITKELPYEENAYSKEEKAKRITSKNKKLVKAYEDLLKVKSQD